MVSAPPLSSPNPVRCLRKGSVGYLSQRKDREALTHPAPTWTPNHSLPTTGALLSSSSVLRSQDTQVTGGKPRHGSSAQGHCWSVDELMACACICRSGLAVPCVGALGIPTEGQASLSVVWDKATLRLGGGVLESGGLDQGWPCPATHRAPAPVLLPSLQPLTAQAPWPTGVTSSQGHSLHAGALQAQALGSALLGAAFPKN